MKITPTIAQIALYRRLISDVERTTQVGGGSSNNSVQRLECALNMQGEVHELLEEADRRVFRLSQAP